MRYIRVNSLEKGMLVGRSLISGDSIYLTAGQRLTVNLIEKIRMLGYSGLYILDSYSEDLMIETLVSDELRNIAIKSIENTFVSSLNKDKRKTLDNIQDNINIAKDITSSIIM
jgi:hypothetical protein